MPTRFGVNEMFPLTQDIIVVSRCTWYLITDHEYADGKLLNKYTYDNPL